MESERQRAIRNPEVRIEKHASYNSENNHFLATSSLQQETLGKHEHQERIKFQGRRTSHSKLLSVARLDEPTLSCLFRGTSYVSAAATPNFDFPLHPPLRTRDRLRLISIEVETDTGKQCERLETWLM